MSDINNPEYRRRMALLAFTEQMKKSSARIDSLISSVRAAAQDLREQSDSQLSRFPAAPYKEEVPVKTSTRSVEDLEAGLRKAGLDIDKVEKPNSQLDKGSSAKTLAELYAQVGKFPFKAVAVKPAPPNPYPTTIPVGTQITLLGFGSTGMFQSDYRDNGRTQVDVTFKRWALVE